MSPNDKETEESGLSFWHRSGEGSEEEFGFTVTPFGPPSHLTKDVSLLPLDEKHLRLEVAQEYGKAHTNGADIREANGSATATKIEAGDTAKAFGINVDETDNEEEVDTSEVVEDKVEEEVQEEVLEEETFEL